MAQALNFSAIALTVMALTCHQAQARPTGTDPLEFSYRISGGQKVRPTLVFNDGSDTFIQPHPETDSEITIKGAEYERQGPYLVIRGVVDEFRIVSKKNGVAIITHTPAGKSSAVVTPVDTKSVNSTAVELANTAAPKMPPAQAVAALKGPSKETKPAVIPSAPAVSAAPSKPEPSSTSVASVKEAGVKVESKPVDKEVEARAKTFVNELATETVCQPKVDKKESAFVVSFATKSSTLSSVSLDRLRMAVGDTASVYAVTGFAEDASNSDRLAASRAKTIADAIKDFGVPSSKIVIGTRTFTGVGTELRIEHGKVRECEMPAGALVVIAPDKSRMTVAANTDARKVMERIAKDVGLNYRVDGPVPAINLNVVLRDQPLIKVLESIGNSLGDEVDVVLRADEVILRYQAKK